MFLKYKKRQAKNRLCYDGMKFSVFIAFETKHLKVLSVLKKRERKNMFSRIFKHEKNQKGGRNKNDGGDKDYYNIYRILFSLINKKYFSTYFFFMISKNVLAFVHIAL